MATNQQMVQQAYQEVLGRNPDAGGLANYTQALQEGWEGITDYNTLKQDLMKSDEYRNRNRGGGEGGGHEIHGGGGEGGGGGGGTTAAELIETYKSSLGDIAQKEFETYSKYAPQFAQKQQEIIKDLYPTQSGLGELVAKDISRRLQVEDYAIPDALKNQYQRNRRAADADRGLLRSGMSGRAESEDLTRLGMQMRQNDINTAMGLYAGIPKVQPMQGIPGQGAAQQMTGLGFQAQQSALDRSLQGSLAAQRNELSRYGMDLNAQLGYDRLGLEQQQMQFDQGNAYQAPNPWVQLGGQVAGGALSGYIGSLF